MQILTWTMIIFYIVGIFGTALLINMPREPMGPRQAMISAILGSLTIMVLLYWMYVG